MKSLDFYEIEKIDDYNEIIKIIKDYLSDLKTQQEHSKDKLFHRDSYYLLYAMSEAFNNAIQEVRRQIMTDFFIYYFDYVEKRDNIYYSLILRKIELYLEYNNTSIEHDKDSKHSFDMIKELLEKNGALDKNELFYIPDHKYAKFLERIDYDLPLMDKLYKESYNEILNPSQLYIINAYTLEINMENTFSFKRNNDSTIELNKPDVDKIDLTKPEVFVVQDLLKFDKNTMGDLLDQDGLSFYLNENQLRYLKSIYNNTFKVSLEGDINEIVLFRDTNSAYESCNIALGHKDGLRVSYLNISLNENNKPYVEKGEITIPGIDTNINDNTVTEGLKINPDGSILFTLKPKKSYMDEYAEVHKLIVENYKNKNFPAVKDNLCFLFTLIGTIEKEVLYSKKKINEDLRKDAIDARALAINDFKIYMRKLQSVDKSFDFVKYYEDSHYGKLVVSITPDNIKGMKRLLSTILLAV